MTTYYIDNVIGSNSNTTTQAQSPSTPWASVDHYISTATGASDIGMLNNTGTPYSVASSLTYPSGRNDLGNVAPYSIIGYNGMPTIQASAPIAIFTLAGNNVLLANLILDCNNTATHGIEITAGSPERGMTLDNLVIKNGFASYGVHNPGNPLTAHRLLIMGGKSSATGGWFGGGWVTESAFVNNACHGVSFGGSNLGMLFMDRCVFANNTGTGTCGLYLENAISGSGLKNCSIYNNAADGVNFAGSFGSVAVIDSVIALNNGYGLNCAFNTGAARGTLNYNAFDANVSGPRNNVTAGSNDITLSGDPFVSGTGSVASLADVWVNFALNSTAGAGALCRGAAGVGGLDLGAVQSAAGGATTNIIVNKVTTNYLIDEGAI